MNTMGHQVPTLLGVKQDDLCEGLAIGDYKDPRDYQFPKRSMVYEYAGEVLEASKQPATYETAAVEVQVRKPTGHAEH
jgi:hypothetical protein